MVKEFVAARSSKLGQNFRKSQADNLQMNHHEPTYIKDLKG
jgi:hypothetical protein